MLIIDGKFDGSSAEEFEWGYGDENDVKGATRHSVSPCHVDVPDPTTTPSLPKTGTSTWWMAGLASLLVATGGALTLVRRRRVEETF